MEKNTQIIALDSDGNLVLESEDGEIQALPSMDVQPSNALVYLLIDCSGSMYGAKLLKAKKGSMDFAYQAFTKGYRVGRISFASNALHICNPINDPHQLAHAVDRLTADGGTDMAPAIKDATARLSAWAGLTRAMVIVTDGVTVNP